MAEKCMEDFGWCSGMGVPLYDPVMESLTSPELQTSTGDDKNKDSEKSQAMIEQAATSLSFSRISSLLDSLPPNIHAGPSFCFGPFLATAAGHMSVSAPRSLQKLPATMMGKQNPMDHWIETHAADMFFGIFIVLNSFVLAIETDFRDEDNGER